MLIGKFYNRHDFCPKYYKGWCVAMGILIDIALCDRLKNGDVLQFLLQLSDQRLSEFEASGHQIMERIAMGCNIHKFRSVYRVAALPSVIPTHQRDLFIQYNRQLDTIADAEQFGNFVTMIVTKLPKTANYYSYWTSPTIINRAYPRLSRSDEAIEHIKNHQQDIEWMHHDLKQLNWGLKKNCSLEEAIMAAFHYTNSAFRQESMTARGYLTQRRKFRKITSGSIEDGRGPDRQHQFINHNTSKTKHSFGAILIVCHDPY